MVVGPPRGKRAGQASERPFDLLQFRPWMLALAVFLACAMGIAIMERSRGAAEMWAQAPVADHR